MWPSVVEEDFTSVYPDENVNILVPLLQRYKLVVVYDSDHKLIGQVSRRRPAEEVPARRRT